MNPLDEFTGFNSCSVGWRLSSIPRGAGGGRLLNFCVIGSAPTLALYPQHTGAGGSSLKIPGILAHPTLEHPPLASLISEGLDGV